MSSSRQLFRMLGRSFSQYLRGNQRMSRRRGSPSFWQVLVSLLVGLGGSVLSVSSATAAERLTIRMGPIQQSITAEELETFAFTGELPSRLRPYSPLFNNDLRLALTSHVQIDPSVSDNLVEDLLQSSSGERFLELLEMAIPDSHPEQFETALKRAARQPQGLSLLGFLEAFPAEEMTVDAVSAIALASQLNLPRWQSHALNSILERELTVETEPFYGSFDPSAPGFEQVRQQTLTFRDRERDRSIPVDLYWSRWSSGPLVIISHGFGADRRFLNYMANHLASHGLTVAALEHPGSNVTWLTGITLGEDGSKLSDILPATEFVERPKDISFLLDEFERLNRYSSVLGGKLNTDQVTVIGHSLGGFTALALAGAQMNLSHLRQFCEGRSLMSLSPADWLQCSAVDLPNQSYDLRDRRVTQVMAMSPVMGRIFDAEGLNQADVPLIVVSSSQDSITPSVSQQLLPFTAFEQREDVLLLTAIGATHLSTGDPANLNEAVTQNIFLRERRRDETEAMRRMLKGLSLAFIKQQTPEADLYAPFLSAAYVQSWSTEAVQLRLNPDVPPALRNWLNTAAVPLEQVIAASMPKRKSIQNATYTTSVRILTQAVPLVLFIPPSQVFLVAVRFLNQTKRRNRSKRKRYLL